MDMFCSYMRTLWIMTIVYTLKHCKTEVTEVSYSTSYPADSGEDYIVNGEQLTLECVFTGALGTLSWWTERDGSQLIFSGSPGNANILDTVYKSRIDEQNSVFTSASHQLVITVSKHQDDEQEFKCSVAPPGSPFGSDKRRPLGEILVHPSSISLDGLGVVIEGIQQTIVCRVNSVFRGQEVTEVSVKVGDSTLTSGTKSQTAGSVSGTYNVKYTQTVTFTYSQHQGQEVQCEVIWMDGTSVKTVRKSVGTKLDIYVKPTATTLQVSKSSAVEGSSVILTCSTSSNPSPRMRLYRQREGQASSNIRTQTGITNSWGYNVQSEDKNAEFYCRVDDNKDIQGWEFDIHSQKHQLTVWYKPSISLSANTSPNPSEGETREIECTTTPANPEPVLSVYRGDVVVKSVTGRTITYSVDIIREINGVQFKCTATSLDAEKYDYSVTSVSRYYTVLFKASELTLTGAPPTFVPEDTEVTVTCTTDEGNPTPVVEWHRDGQPVPVDTDLETVMDTDTDGTQYHGKVRVGTLKIQSDRTLNGMQYRCAVEDTDLEKSFTLGVTYPPEVSVQTPSNTLVTKLQLVVTCDVEAGNPESLTSLYWEFEPKYPDTQSQALPGQRGNRELRIERTVYSDAGTYRCTAGNIVGSDTGEIQIVIHYPPQLVSSDPLIFYSGLDQQISLNITVRVFPEFSDPDSAFTWTTSSGSQITDGVTSTKLSDEIFYSELLISSVKGEDYTSYIVTAGNGVKEPVIFTMDLLQKGPPESPRDVTVAAVAAEQANITWITGLNGGYPQTFRVLVKEKDNIGDQHFHDTSPQNPQDGSPGYFIITNLSPETEYEIVVRSMNGYNGGSYTDSETTTLITRAKPSVNPEDLMVEYKGSVAKLTWQYEVIDPEITQVVIEQCTLNGICNEYNVTGNTEKSLEVPGSDEDIFYLVIYQDGLEAYRSARFIVVTEAAASMEREDKTVAVAVSVTVVIVVIGIIVPVVLYMKYKHKFKRNRKYESEGGQSSPAHLYMNDVSQTSNYMDLDRNDNDNKLTEYQVINTGVGVTSNEIGIYEDIRKSKHVTMQYDQDLTLGNLIKKGRYSVLHKGSLQMKGQQIAVMVKSINADICVSEAQYIFNEVSCLEQIPGHPRLIELFSFGITAPMDFKLVTRYYKNGDLRQFLQQEHFQDKEAFFNQMVLGILQGLSYLEDQRHEILHYQLSSEHVLVDDTNSCRLTGFGFKEHVLQREMKEEDQGIYGAIQWKAPEVIEDCKAHSRASDIWAFGILLHEIYSLGSMPYDGMIEDDIKTFVKEGNILEKLGSCPINVYQMMKQCWAYDPEKRPRFTSLLRKCQILRKPDLGAVEKSESSPYENVSARQHHSNKALYANARA